MRAVSKFRFVIGYYNAIDDSFAEMERKATSRSAITKAKVYILTEHLRYERDLNAHITNDLHPEDPAIVIKLSELLIKPSKNGLKKT
jgi:hypothetical protein